MPPSASAPVSPNKQNENWVYPAPQQKDPPTGDEPKQQLKFIYTDYKGEKQTFYLANTTFRWAAKPASAQPESKQEGDQTLAINAQPHPLGPTIVVNIPKEDIVNHIATLGDSSISTEGLASVKHIASPHSNPPKPSKA